MMSSIFLSFKQNASMIQTVLQLQVLHCFTSNYWICKVQICIPHCIQAGNYITGSSRLNWDGAFNELSQGVRHLYLQPNT